MVPAERCGRWKRQLLRQSVRSRLGSHVLLDLTPLGTCRLSEMTLGLRRWKVVLKFQERSPCLLCLPLNITKKYTLQHFYPLLFKKQTNLKGDFWGHSLVLEQSLPALKIQHIVHIPGNYSQVQLYKAINSPTAVPSATPWLLNCICDSVAFKIQKWQCLVL